MSDFRVSILIPVWNAARFLREALDSAIAQSLPAVEIIVGDNASTDATPEILSSYSGHSEVKTFRHSENIGSARNFAAVAQRATGDFLLWLPADDRLHPHLLETAAKRFNQHAEVGMWFCGYEVIDDLGRQVSQHSAEMFRPGVLEGQRLVNYMLTSGQPMLVNGTVVRRSAFDAVGGLDTQFLGVCDFDLYLRIAGRYSIYVEPAALAIGRRHREQHSNRIIVRDNGDPDRLFEKVAKYDFLSEDQRRRYVEGLCDYARQYFSRPLRTHGIAAADVVRHRGLVRERLLRWQSSGLPYARYVRRWPTRPLGLAAWLAGATRPGVWLARTALAFGPSTDLSRPDEVSVDPGSELAGTH